MTCWLHVDVLYPRRISSRPFTPTQVPPADQRAPKQNRTMLSKSARGRLQCGETRSILWPGSPASPPRTHKQTATTQTYHQTPSTPNNKQQDGHDVRRLLIQAPKVRRRIHGIRRLCAAPPADLRKTKTTNPPGRDSHPDPLTHSGHAHAAEPSPRQPADEPPRRAKTAEETVGRGGSAFARPPAAAVPGSGGKQLAARKAAAVVASGGGYECGASPRGEARAHGHVPAAVAARGGSVAAT